jgi:CBS domain-containing protein
MLKLADIMTRDPVTVEPEMSLKEVADLLATRGISGVPVVTESGTVVGVISASDIVSFAAAVPGIPTDRSEQFSQWGETEPDNAEDEDEDTPEEFFAGYWEDSEAEVVERMREPGPEWDRLDEHTVGEVMTRRIEALSVDADLATAAARMTRARVHRLIVTDGDKLAGVVCASDFVRAVAAGKLRG